MDANFEVLQLTFIKWLRYIKFTKYYALDIKTKEIVRGIELPFISFKD